jgi:hypothetical protein
VLTILRGGAPGRIEDPQARAVIPFLEKHLSERPKIIISNMPGLPPKSDQSHLYKRPNRTGPSVGAVGPILGLTGTMDDLEKLIYLGDTEIGYLVSFSAVRRLGTILRRSSVPLRASE